MLRDPHRSRAQSLLLWARGCQYLTQNAHVQAAADATLADRDLAALRVLDAYKLLRLVFFTRAPLLESRIAQSLRDRKMNATAGHPLFHLPFLQPARRDGSWAKWSAFICSYHNQESMLYGHLHDPLLTLRPRQDSAHWVKRMSLSIQVGALGLPVPCLDERTQIAARKSMCSLNVGRLHCSACP